MRATLESYRANGVKAGEAMKRRDFALMRHFSEWIRRAITIETPEDQLRARAAYDEGYREGSGFYNR